MMAKRLILLIINSGLIILSKIGFGEIILKEPECSRFIIIKKSDTLWKLAKRYYGCGNQWHKFKKYNVFTNPNLIYPGEKLAISFKEGTCLISKLRKQIEELSKEKTALLQELEKEKAEYIKLQNKNYEIIKEKEAYINRLEAKIKHLEESISLLEDSCKELKEKINAQKELIDSMETEIKNIHRSRETLYKIAHMLGFTIVSGVFALEALKK
jgi:uncharacterized protein YoxC